MLQDVFEVTDRSWRGIGMIPQSGWRLSRPTGNTMRSTGSRSPGYTAESEICRSGEVLQGMIKPHECAAFGKECTPETRWARRWSPPRACAAYYLYRRLR
jgi:hydrogenase expression/formation protein HypD